MNSGENSCGFVYVATGAPYLEEARRSAAGLRRFNPETRICLVTDRTEGRSFWDDLVILDKPVRGFRDKLEMRRAPYSRCVYLDSDTTVWGDLSALFTVLDRYDVCGVQYSEGQDYEMEGGIPPAFPEMNSGLIGFRSGPSTAGFFDLWVRFYDEFRSLNRDGHYHYANVGDQKSLRAALWHSDVRHAAIGSEFNFIPLRVELVSLPVAVLHTRSRADLASFATRLNARLGRRAYVPVLNAVVSDSMGMGELRRLATAAAKLLLRGAGRLVVPRFLRDRLRPRLLGNPLQNPDRGAEGKWEKPSNGD